MSASNASERRALHNVAFFALCLAVAFAWDVAYARICDLFGPDPEIQPWVPLTALLLAPIALCFAIGLVTYQWLVERSRLARLAAAAWCVVAPLLVLPPFVGFMCWAFRSCFGD